MLMTTSDTLPGHEIAETIGIVSANSVRARHVGRDIMAGFKNITGGEVGTYRDLLTQSRHEALERLQEAARDLGADAIVTVRITSAEVMAGMAEILTYGTAVKLRR